ncbi:hypothetical protein [Caudoviricetes sp.]|nr:hypothetical protein [Caudoviricetes sp.]
MPIKMTLDEYEQWAEDTFTPEADLYVDDESVFADDTTFSAGEFDPSEHKNKTQIIEVMDCGWIHSNYNSEFQSINQVKHIRSWRKKRNSITLSFLIDKSQAQALIDFAKTLKAKQIK